MIPTSPTSILKAQRKVVCSVCTVDASHPVMIDEDRFADHVRARPHRRLAKKMTPEQYREAHGAKQREPKATPEPAEIDMDPTSLFSLE